MNDETLVKLRAPFTGDQVGHLPKVVCKPCSDRSCAEHKRKTCGVCKAYLGKHIHIDYVGHAHVTERLLLVDPTWNWEPLALDGQGLPARDENGGMWIRLEIGGVQRLGYGHAGAKRGGDAIKEVIGDAIRNAAMRFGVALDLWKKEPAGPAAEAADAPVLTPDQRAIEMRNVIMAEAKRPPRRWGIAAIDGDFHTWSRGEKEFRTADVETLEQYRAYLKAGAQS
ncbi:hypothetical protein ACIOD2_32175 [Amycolatopsis sp. NPDC088138]|uniref:hypothetical protein n=1 Tax=Amycolatopsis sp. NPDC088138 TaxID=3363938 RepID=UPI0038073ED3